MASPTKKKKSTGGKKPKRINMDSIDAFFSDMRRLHEEANRPTSEVHHD